MQVFPAKNKYYNYYLCIIIHVRCSVHLSVIAVIGKKKELGRDEGRNGGVHLRVRILDKELCKIR